MAEKRAAEIKILAGTLPLLPRFTSETDPFETLVMILSQKATDKNTTHAVENQSKHFETEPGFLVNANFAKLEQHIRVAGLNKNQAKAIKQVLKRIQEDCRENLKHLLLLSLKTARKSLLQLLGVGPKTANIVLLFSADQSTIPADTHVSRVVKHSGLAAVGGDCSSVRGNFQYTLNQLNYFSLNLLLIAHGFKHCKSRHCPCDEYPVDMYCHLKGLWFSR